MTMPDDSWFIVTVATVSGAASIGGCIGSMFGEGYVIPCSAIGASVMLLERILWRKK